MTVKMRRSILTLNALKGLKNKKIKKHVTAANKHGTASRWEWLNFLSSEIKVAPCPAAA